MISNRPVQIAVIAGVRPQFIKVSFLQQAITLFNSMSTKRINATYINSGQHYSDELSHDLIKELNIKFDVSLVNDDKDPNHMLGNMLIGISDAIKNMSIRPRWIVVMGDATTTLVGALCAIRLGIPVVHLEAGVRSGDLSSVEEIHRRVVSHISYLHFCTSKSGVSNLANENITKNVFWSGDTTYDFFMKYAGSQSTGIMGLKDYILVTLHKPVNINSDEILSKTIEHFSLTKRTVIFITHPRTKARLLDLELHKNKKILFLDSLPYNQMIAAIKGAAFLYTDSGGLQRESYYLKKRCLVRRDSLGWSWMINAGINKLVGYEKESVQEGLEWMEDQISNCTYPNIDGEFIKDESWKFVLNTLIGLS